MIQMLVYLKSRYVADGDFFSGLDGDLGVQDEMVVREDDVRRVGEAGVRQQTEGREEGLQSF
jgi:hypothetical protein